MSRALWLALGVGVGFLAAHKVNGTERGRAAFQKADASITKFTDAVARGYRGDPLEVPGLHTDPTTLSYSADLDAEHLAESVDPAAVDPADPAAAYPQADDSVLDGPSLDGPHSR